jgi:hypothetical protein
MITDRSMRFSVVAKGPRNDIGCHVDDAAGSTRARHGMGHQNLVKPCRAQEVPGCHEQ